MNKETKSAVLLTEKEVQEYYKINVNTLQRNRSVGLGLPYVKPRGRLRRIRAYLAQTYESRPYCAQRVS